MTVNFGVVLVTATSEAEAENLAKSLVEHKLAACVSLSPKNGREAPGFRHGEERCCGFNRLELSLSYVIQLAA